MIGDIISAQELVPYLHDPNWAVIDCRFDLKDPGWGTDQFLVSHIPGAQYAHLDRDLSGPIIKGQTGRHPLPSLEHLVQVFSNWGIDSSTQVVVYDSAGGAFAARLWWLLRYAGHASVAVLDGGYQLWQQAGLPTTAEVTPRAPTRFIPHLHPEMMVTTADIEQMLNDPGVLLIDARAPERYRGEIEPIDPVAGHIPGAVNRFHAANLGDQGTFLPAETLRTQFLELVGENIPMSRVIVYCGSGVTSCHHLVAMERAGLPGARLYVGSWSEWLNHHSPG